MNIQEPPSQDLHQLQSSTENGNYHFPLGIFLLLGPLIGVALLLIYMSGAYDEWRYLNSPPSRPIEFAGVSIYFYQAAPYILAEDGETYFCDVQGSSVSGRRQVSCAWKIEQVSSDIVLDKCQQSGVKFWGWKKPFDQVVDCAAAVMAGEFVGAPELTFVIDDDGKLWYWAQDNKGNMTFYLPGVVILGLLAGFGVAVIWNPVLTLLRNPLPGHIDALWNWEVRTLRWGGRLGSIPSLIYFAVLILINHRFLIPDDLKDALLAFTLVGGAIGLILGWRWEIAGGSLVLLASVAASSRYLSGTSLNAVTKDLYGILLFWIPYLPGLFFLLAGVLSHRKQKNEQTYQRSQA